MNEKILFVGLDVDNKAFTGHYISADQNVSGNFRVKPNIGSLQKYLERFRQDGFRLKICYEASYLGFSLYRDLRKNGFECEVIASSLIPKTPGEQVKTDRLDSRKLAEYYMKGLLTIVYVPDEHDENIRDLIRARKFMSEQIRGLRSHVLGLCCRIGIQYQNTSLQGERASFWTRRFYEWLEHEIKNQDPVFKINIDLLLLQLRQLEEVVQRYSEEIERLAATDRYSRKVQSLVCYRGIATLSAMSLITEIGDIKRFSHPRKLVSYAGMDLREYSSGGKERKYSMTKLGNKFIRTVAIESSQFSMKPVRISRDLKERRMAADPKFIEIADRAMLRINKKASRLLFREKPRNKAKTACARELLCFVWESLNAAA